MFNELIVASQSVQALTSLLKAANSLANYNEIVAAVSDVNVKLMQSNAAALEAQQTMSQQSSRIAELEKQVEAFEEWGEEAKAYGVVEVAHGVFAAVPHERAGNLQATQKLCLNCFNQRTKSILQQSHEDRREIGLACHRCKAKVVFRYYVDAV
ncbi:hypothetical protein [Hydrogenophaga sp. IBVHS1]|uniref:hypothetical protein n=1 Tax=unclassified Hydrogenophaga TaxID=2610897 RepID=UPI000A2E8ECA|nr:hypothetical protein [Hydrogenophaga sp. IBVHS1]OSZ75018.1 hypothetical protein CAP37_06130 [Hydrogenophaga sp. IBVHS1]